MKSGNKKAMFVIIIGNLIVALILVIGTIWSGRNASKDTETAVRNVSLFYLDELAGRREEVVSSTLNDYISDLDVAIGLITPEDLSSLESLQAYQLHMKQLYSLEKFAFIDETGLIYTSRGTRSDIDQYEIDYKTLSSPEISLKNQGTDDIKVVIAMPTDRLPFENTHLLVCFMEIDMSTMLESISFQSGSNGTTFCNIYTPEGESLTNMVLGGLASEDNLLTALENATFEDGYDLGSMRQDFAQNNSGVASFTYNGITETMYYVPIHKTNWMLTYLIRESVISDQIDTISNGIVNRSLFMSLITALVLTIVFVIMIIQTKKAMKLTMDAETSELMQQELEERLALQEELLNQEKARAQQDSMINALASDYRSVYYVDLEKDSAICYRNDSENDFAANEKFEFTKVFTDYAMTTVAEDYRDAFLEFIKLENIRKGLASESIIALRYLTIKDGQESYEMLRMADANTEKSREDGIIRSVGVGFTDIDHDMRDSLAKNQALSDALKTAEEASRAKTVFLSSMSHEIRTPMNAIIGLDTLALNEPELSPTIKDYLEKIGTSAHHLLSLINDILDMSRIESGRMTLNNEEFSFSELMDQINVIFTGQCQEKELTYNCNVIGNLCDFYVGDSTKLRQVLINILGNAVKFTPEGGKVEFRVEKTGGFSGKSNLKFTIRDTGIGMSKDYLPKIFDAFSQENSGSTNKYGSSGLGMAISKRIIDMMNGEIKVESEKNVGTTFTVNVTLIDSDKKNANNSEIEIRPQDMRVPVIDDDSITCDQSKDATLHKAELEGRRVLLAEDMEVNAQILMSLLEMRGVIAEHALNGKIALEMFESHPEHYYDAILMDMRMPEMDGLTATAKIRALNKEDAATIPIIALTANAFDEDVQRSLQAGLNAHLSKPIEPDILFETLEHLIS